MGKSDSKSEKRLVKGLLMAIVLSAIFACSFATIVVLTVEKIQNYNSFVVLIFLLALLALLALLPLVFIGIWGFLLFRRIYIKRDYISFQASNKDNGNVNISVKKTIDSDSKSALDAFQQLLLEQLQKTSSK